MSRKTYTDQNMEKNVSIVSDETLKQWAEVLEETIDSAADDAELIIELAEDWSRADYDSAGNRLQVYVEDASGEQHSIVLKLDPAGEYGTRQGASDVFFDLVLAEDSHGGEYTVAVQNDPDRGLNDIREGLLNLLKDYFG